MLFKKKWKKGLEKGLEKKFWGSPIRDPQLGIPN